MTPSTTRRPPARAALTSLLALSASLTVGAGCGGDPLDAQGQSLAESAGRAVAGLEAASSTGWVLSGLDLGGNADPDAIRIAALVLNDVLGLCVHASTRPAPALGMTVAFDDRCSIPLTPIQFHGDMALDFAPRGDGRPGSTLTVAFHRLTLLDTVLDGSLRLGAQGDAFAYEARGLSADLGGRTVTVDGRGTMTTTGFHTAIEFDGDGMITSEYGAFAFEARGLHRALRDCYPDDGTLTLRITELGVTRAMTLHFDGDTRDSGKVKVDWAGGEHEWLLPVRGCADR